VTTSTAFIAAKHGVGCSVTTAAFALSRPGRTLLVDMSDDSDMPAILGVYSSPEGITINDRLDLLIDPDFELPVTAPYDHVVIDGGVDSRPEADRSFLVTTACYLALNRAIRQCLDVDGAVLIAEHGRALLDRDIEAALGVTVVATVNRDAAIARCVDAGLLASRVPRLFTSLDQLPIVHTIREDTA